MRAAKFRPNIVTIIDITINKTAFAYSRKPLGRLATVCIACSLRWPAPYAPPQLHVDDKDLGFNTMPVVVVCACYFLS